MDIKRPKGVLFEPEIEEKLRGIARFIAEHEDTEEDEMFRLLRRDMHRIFSELEMHGESEMLGIGLLKRGKDGRTRFHKYPEEVIRMKQQLGLQQQYGGALGNVGDQPLREFNVQLSVNSVIKELIGLMAEKRSVPADELEKLFWKQMEQAYDEFMETGTGYLPDFGSICFAEDEGMRDLEFNPNREMTELYEKYHSGEQDDE